MFYLFAIFPFYSLSPVKHAEHLGLNGMNKAGANEFPLRCRVGEGRLMLFTQALQTAPLNEASLITAVRLSSLDHQRCSSATADVSQTQTSPEGGREPRCGPWTGLRPTPTQIPHLHG